MFYKLDIVITETQIKISFGIGIIKKGFQIEKIVDVKPVRNPAMVGWGIRITPGYSLYNVSGLDAIELTLKDKIRKVRIGTDSKDEIVEYINKIIKKS
ncbi:hypothetical protein WSM22_19180 [Cytophagales bacterium WSM2-2]|nr:hypothetical protein WSM22_19180 [Cytophagales bacterium WSM2-2]